MGDVYLAQDMVLGRRVALKVLPSETRAFPDRLQRFVQEAKAASALNHPNIATIHELREAEGIHFIVMEYVEGETLKAKVTRGPLDSSEIVRLATEMAEALDAAHRAGIIHRDVKSANIMITRRGHVKMLDFGLATRTAFHEPLDQDSTGEATLSSRAVMGTVPYMSPEQALGHKLDQRSDLFSLGVVLYEMATGHLPFSGSTPFETVDNIIHHDPEPITSTNPGIPAGLARLILRCLEKRAERRIGTAAELAADLGKSERDAQVDNRDDVFKSNLPQQLTPFIGRQKEIAGIREVLRNTRLVTLTGPGGIGKTRLALQVAAESLREYDDGVWFVELASLLDARLVTHTVASTVGVPEQGGRSIADAVVECFQPRRLLLVLDNCEHVVTACAQLADLLLRRAPALRILATSRETLGITGEAIVRVPPLGVPDPRRLPDLESLAEHEAVALFIDRARSVKSEFALTGSTALAVATLCVQLEGIPLAIELAASRMKALSIDQIVARLSDRLKLLTGGSRTASPRHQTLLAAIDWSYNLLTEPEKILFRRLAGFSGGWTLEAAEAVCAGGGVERESVLELLSGLVDKSLVLPEERDGQQRYRFMVTIAEYAHKHLMETAEGPAIIRGHARFFVALAEEGESKLWGTEQKTWLDRLNAEYDNMRSVLNWTSHEDADTGLHLAGTLGRFWYLRGYRDEGRRWLAQMLAATGGREHAARRVKALNAAALIAMNQGEYASARAFAEEALLLSRECGDRPETAMALNTLAVVAGKQSDFAASRSLLEECLTIRRELGDKRSIAPTLNNAAILALRQYELAAAKSLFDESLAMAREVGDTHAIATALINRGEVARRMGDYTFAQSLTEESLALARDIGDNTVIPIALNCLGDLAARQGDLAAARAFHTKGLDLARELGDRHLIADLLLSLGLAAEDYQTARSLFQESLGIRRALDERVEIAGALNCLGSLAARQGDDGAARALFEESLAICRQLGAKDGLARSLGGLADLARMQADHDVALSLYKQSLAIWSEAGETPEFMRPLEHLAALVMARGQFARAVRLWGAAQALRETIAVPRQPSETDEFDNCVSAARAALGGEGFAEAWTQGRTMNTNRIIAFALEGDET
jgi:non-specific serine/threonine protein kinase